MNDEYSQDFDFVKYTDMRGNRDDDLDSDYAARNRALRGSADDDFGDTPIPDPIITLERRSEEPEELPEDPFDEPPYDELPYEADVLPEAAPEEEYEPDPEPVRRADPEQQKQFSREYEFDREQALERIRIAREKRELADQLAKDKLHAEILMVSVAIVVVAVIVFLLVKFGKKKDTSATFTNLDSTNAVVDSTADSQEVYNDSLGAPEKELTSTGDPVPQPTEGHVLTDRGGVTFVDDILIVNKTYGLPESYDPGGITAEAQEAFDKMAAQAWSEGISLWICSGYRSYAEQEQLFEQYAYERGLEEADAVSARPGHSEHQSGLAFDVNSTDFSFEYTAEAQWLEQHCAEFGFIVRFPRGKEYLTGYDYEPWHLRFVGIKAAQEMKAQNLCLEEYLGIPSDYEKSPDNETFRQKYSQYSSDSTASLPDQNTSDANAGTWDNGNTWDNGGNTWDNGGNTWDNGGNTWDNGGNTWDDGGNTWDDGNAWDNGYGY